MRTPSGIVFTLLLALLAGSPSGKPAPETRYELGEPRADGIGKFYLGREIARTTGPETADWQQRPTRQAEQRPDLLITHLGLEPDDVVADIGAGVGYHAFRIAPRLSRGKVIAVEIDPLWLTMIEERARNEGVTNIETVLGTATDSRLSPESVDLVLLVDVYHEFSHPVEMMEAIKKALKPDGRIALVEYRLEDPKVRVPKIHKMTLGQIEREMSSLGLERIEGEDDLPQQHLMFFRKLGAASGPEGPDRAGQ